MDFITIKLNTAAAMPPGSYAGQEVRVSTDEHGTPLEQIWRRRLRDAKVDGCCEIIKEKASRVSKKSTSKHTRSSGSSNDGGGE